MPDGLGWNTSLITLTLSNDSDGDKKRGWSKRPDDESIEDRLALGVELARVLRSWQRSLQLLGDVNLAVLPSELRPGRTWKIRDSVSHGST